VYCQVFDSIFGDVPLSKVNFAARQEFEYVKNFKFLQACFDKHGIPNYIPVERLMKCKFQDNIEFLQWVKKYWDAHFTISDYDAVSRRRGTCAPSSFRHRIKPGVEEKVEKTPPAPAVQPARGRAPVTVAQSNAMTEQLQVATRERDFYFGKLRDMEIMLDTWEAQPVVPSVMIDELRSVLYKVEEGFEVPE